jgi:hypothetical protein
MAVHGSTGEREIVCPAPSDVCARLPEAGAGAVRERAIENARRHAGEIWTRRNPMMGSWSDPAPMTPATTNA